MFLSCDRFTITGNHLHAAELPVIVKRSHNNMTTPSYSNIYAHECYTLGIAIDGSVDVLEGECLLLLWLFSALPRELLLPPPLFASGKTN